MTIFISEMIRKVIVILKNSLKTWSEIQWELQNEYSTTVSKRGMQKIWQKYLKTKKIKDLASFGRPRKLSQRHERIIKRISSANNKLSVLLVCAEFISGCSTTIPASTIKRILKKYGIHGYRSIRKPFLTITQRRKRMLLTNNHKAYNFSQWKNVVFSDESIFRFYSAYGKHWVLRTTNNKGKPEHMHETMSHGS